MKAFRSNWIQVLPGVSTLLMMTLGVFASGCDGGEKDLFTNGFTCQESLLFDSGRDCSSSASAAISFVSPNL